MDDPGGVPGVWQNPGAPYAQRSLRLMGVSKDLVCGSPRDNLGGVREKPR
jgi:hypothetical protein